MCTWHRLLLEDYQFLPAIFRQSNLALSNRQGLTKLKGEEKKLFYERKIKLANRGCFIA